MLGVANFQAHATVFLAFDGKMFFRSKAALILFSSSSKPPNIKNTAGENKEEKNKIAQVMMLGEGGDVGEAMMRFPSKKICVKDTQTTGNARLRQPWGVLTLRN